MKRHPDPSACCQRDIAFRELPTGRAEMPIIAIGTDGVDGGLSSFHCPRERLARQTPDQRQIEINGSLESGL